MGVYWQKCSLGPDWSKGNLTFDLNLSDLDDALLVKNYFVADNVQPWLQGLQAVYYRSPVTQLSDKCTILWFPMQHIQEVLRCKAL